MVRHTRSRRWTEQELQALLDIWAEPAVAAEIATYTSVRKPVFTQITDRLNAQFGNNWHRDQISSKVRDMRKLYRTLFEGGKYGATTRYNWPYFETMQKIVGNETSVTPQRSDRGGKKGASGDDRGDVSPDGPGDEGNYFSIY